MYVCMYACTYVCIYIYINKTIKNGIDLINNYNDINTIFQ